MDFFEEEALRARVVPGDGIASVVRMRLASPWPYEHGGNTVEELRELIAVPPHIGRVLRPYARAQALMHTRTRQCDLRRARERVLARKIVAQRLVSSETPGR
jgi:hypothetical protein